MIDVRRLRVLRELAARGTVAATAEALSYSGPAVSQQLAALEREVGVGLLERDGRRLRLTDAGQLLVHHADVVFGQLEAAEADLAAMAAEVTGTLRVVAFQTASRSLLAPVLGRVAREHPGLELLVDDGEPDEALARLRTREVDVVVAHEYPFAARRRDGAFGRVELGMDELSVAVPGDHPAPPGPIDVATLADDSWIGGHPGTACHAIVLHAGRAAGFEPRLHHRSNDFEVVLALVAAGLGVALVPDLARVGDHPAVRFSRPTTPMGRHLFAAARTGDEGRPAVRVVLDALAASALRPAPAAPRGPSRPGSR